MSNTVIQLKYSTVGGNTPVSLANGEIALNSYDGVIYYAGPDGNIIGFDPWPGPHGLNGEIQFNDSGSLGSNSGLKYYKTANQLSVEGIIFSNTAIASNGYIQFGDGTRQYTANSGSGGGSGTTINVYNANTQVFTETANGTGTTFNLGFTPASQNSVIVTANGVVQYDYSVSSSTLILNFVPTVGTLIRAQTFGTSSANSLAALFQTGNLIVYDGNTLVSLANTNTAGTYGNSTHVPIITTDQYGRVLSVTNTSISGLGASDQYARDTANSAFIHANAAYNQANTGGGADQYARDTANAAFGTANSKTFTFEQNTTPLTANSADFWVNTDTGFMYQNFGNTTNPTWAEVGPTGTLSNTQPGIVSGTVVYANSIDLFAYTNAAFIQANTPSHVANSASSYANAAFIKANTAITTSGGQTITGNLTANAYVAFVVGPAANSGVALQMPREGALRDMTNGSSLMYFDVSNGGTADGEFRFRSSNSFTELVNFSTSGIRATSAYKAKSFNLALDGEVSSDNLKFRVSNSGGIFPQVGSTTGSNVDISWTMMGTVSGVGAVATQNGGALVNSFTSLYTAHGLDNRGDMVVATVVDKNAEKAYRVTFIVSNNSGNTTGYSIIIERIL